MAKRMLFLILLLIPSIMMAQRPVLISDPILKDTALDYFDTITIFNLTPSGSSLPASFGGTASNYTVSGGAINFTGGPGNFTNYITYDSATLAPYAIMTIRYTYVTVSGTDAGIQIGWQSQNAFGANQSLSGGLCVTSGGLGGVPQGAPTYASETPGLSIAGTTTNTNFVNGDKFIVVIQRQDLNFQLTITDSTQGWTQTFPIVTAPHTASGVWNPFVSPNTSFPAIYAMSGTISVTNWEYQILKPHNTQFAIDGNSITFGQNAFTATGDWANNVANPQRTIRQGGGSDVTASVLSRVSEIIKLNPPKVLLMIGGNDILFGVSSATWQANLDSIHDKLNRAGISVIDVYPTPRSGTDMRPLVAFLDSSTHLANDKKLRGTFYGLLASGSSYMPNPAYNTGDGTHPNDAGHLLIGQIVMDSLYLWSYFPYSVPYNDLYRYPVSYGRYTGQHIYGGTQPGGPLQLFGSSASDGGIVNLQDKLYATRSGIGIGTTQPTKDLQVMGTIRMGNPNVGAGSTTYTPLTTYTDIAEVTAYGQGFNRIFVGAPAASNTGIYIGGNLAPGAAQTGSIITQCTDCNATNGLASGSYNFNQQMYALNGDEFIYTTLGAASSPGGDMIFGSPSLSTYPMWIAQTSPYYSGVNLASHSNYNWQVNGTTFSNSYHMQTTIAANPTDSILVATANGTDYDVRKLAATQIPGMITSGTDNLSVANANTTCINYTFTDVNYHTAELGVALSVNSISGGATLTVSASWENAQNSGTESYTWPTVSASGYSGILLIPVTAYKSHAITVTVTWNSAGAVNYNANGIYRQIR